MNSKTASHWLVVSLLAVAASTSAQQAPPAPSLAASVGVLAYPAKGQTAAQQSTDETECYAWSKTQSGYDPKAPPPAAAPVQAAAPAQSGATGARARGAVRGAAAGAVIGEVADNDAGKGAAVGATVGVLAGGRQARKAQEQQKEAAAQQQQASADQAKASQQALADTFKKGMSACLESRGYTVK